MVLKLKMYDLVPKSMQQNILSSEVHECIQKEDYSLFSAYSLAPIIAF